MTDFDAALRALPKAELHVHLDGSARAQTLLDLAWAQRKPAVAPTAGDFTDLIRAGKVFDDLEDYLSAFAHTLQPLQTEPALRRVSHELIEDAARESIHHLEVRFCPALHTSEGLSLEQVVDAVVAGLEEGQRKYEVSFGIVVSGLRDQGPEATLEMARLAARCRDRHVVGFDLAGPENGYPAGVHTQALEVARNAGLGITLHAGEVTDPAAIQEALDLGADRIGHGVKLRGDLELLERFGQLNVALEMCPSSNVQTRAVSGYTDHPVLEFHRRGIPVTVNTDNRLVSSTTVTDELVHLREHHALRWDEAVELCKNSFRYAFLPEDRREELVGRVDIVAEKISIAE